MPDLPEPPAHLVAGDPEERRRFGRYYTPRPLAQALYRLLETALAEARLAPAACTLVDPACGAGALLGAPEARSFRAAFGLDLDPRALAECAKAAPATVLIEGDAYGAGLAALSARVAGTGPAVVVGNPPYVANSELLRSGRYQEIRDSLLPFARDVARGTSVRDDYVLFFGVADRLIEAAGGSGAVAFVTSATFVGNYLYAPLRRWLLSRYQLRSLVELGPEMFEGTRVATALSVWVRSLSGQHGEPFGHLRLQGTRAERVAQLEGPLPLAPAHPHGEGLLLNAPPQDAARDIDAMRAAGQPIGSLFPLSFPGLKTRFEELLVDEDGGRLQARLRDFFEAREPDSFAARHGIPAKALPKLQAAFAARKSTRFSKGAIRPFARFAGPKHRFRVPRDAMAWAYLDPELIPRGDHRMHGSFDPHVLGPKLVFNAREVPLVAAVVEGPACVHDWRHSRFAPLRAPARLLTEGLSLAGREKDWGPPTLNLVPEWAGAAEQLGDPSDLLFYVCAIVNSRLVQKRFAPLVGASEEVPIPLPDARQIATVQLLAEAARRLAPGASLPEEEERRVRELFHLAQA